MSEQLYPLSEFTPEEAAKVAEFEAAETPPEVLREHVQAAAADAVRNMPADWWCPKRSNTTRLSCEYCIAEVAADAALAVFRGQQNPAVQRVLALVRDSDGDEYMHGAIGDSCPACWAEDIRAAIAGDGR